jgi:hypothetical protein
MHQSPRFTHDDIRSIVPFDVGTRATESQCFTEEKYLGERRPQLVRDACAEFESEACELVFALKVSHDDDCEQSSQHQQTDPHWNSGDGNYASLKPDRRIWTERDFHFHSTAECAKRRGVRSQPVDPSS